MHKTIILCSRVNWLNLILCYTHDHSMLVCLPACEFLARQKSPIQQYVVTFSDEYSPGYNRVKFLSNQRVQVKTARFFLEWKQAAWIAALGLKTLDNLVGHFYVKITPFE